MGNHVVQVADVAFRYGVIHQGVAAAQPPNVNLLPAEKWPVAPNLENPGRRRISFILG